MKRKYSILIDWSFIILKWFCPRHLLEEIHGDLLQLYERDINTYGKKRAARKLFWNALRFFRLSIIARNKLSFLWNRNFMLRTNAKVIGRLMVRNKMFSLISSIGLTLGLTVSLLIAQILKFEYSFEDFIKDADRTYRVNLYNTNNGVFDHISSGTVSGLTHSIRQSIPGVEIVGRIGDRTSAIVGNSLLQIEARETDIFFADHSIISLLALDLLSGSEKLALTSPQSLIISEDAAKKYFGSVHVAGQTLEIGFGGSNIEKQRYQVHGVFRNIPANSHLRFEFLLSPPNEASWNENWAWSNVVTYLRLEEKVAPGDLSAGLANIVKQHHRDGDGDRYLLEPIKKIRLHALAGGGRAASLNAFVLLGSIVLLLAWFNYINLSTARFFERMKDVGIRKLIGASRVQLIFHFLTEAIFFNALSFCLAVLLFFIAWPGATQLLGERIPITLFDAPVTVLLILGCVFVSSLCAGFYPSLFLSSFQPLQALRGRLAFFLDRSTLRKGLVVVQFSISIILITGVFAIHRQIEFMRTRDLGISIDQTLIVEEPLLTDVTTVEKYQVLRDEISKVPNVSGVTYASSFPGAEIDWHRTDITLARENADYRFDSRIVAVGAEFLDVFGLTLMAGRKFDPDREGDGKTMLINEQASRMFGFPDYNQALGKLVFVGNRKFEVIGVLKDYHFRSMGQELQPLLHILGYPRAPRLAVRISGGAIPETIAAIEEKWKAAYTPNVFGYYFLDDFFDAQYKNDQNAEVLLSALAFLAIFISCSGLFALAMYSIGGRMKEISIRKVFGASSSHVALMLGRDFFKLVMIAGLIALPLEYQGVSIWLERYAYKMPLYLGVYLIPLGAVVMFALGTISFQIFSAASRSPVKAINHE